MIPRLLSPFSTIDLSINNSSKSTTVVSSPPITSSVASSHPLIMVAPRFALTVYAPLDFTQIAGQPHDLPTGDYRKRLPKFSGNNAITFEDHLEAFLKYVDDLEVEHEDVTMKMFLQTLEGNARIWYMALLARSIDSWESFKRRFSEKWSYKQDNAFMLSEFTSI